MTDPEVLERLAARHAELDGLEERTAVRQAAAPVTTRAIGETLGRDAGGRGELEPLRGKLTQPADRSWPRKRPDGKFTARPQPGAQEQPGA